MEVAPGTDPSRRRAKFGDVQLHVEWAAPNPPVGKGQDRGNSGIFLMGQFEVQVLDSYKADTYADGQAGADLYGQYPPLFNAVAAARPVANLRYRLPPPAVRPGRQAARAGPVHRLHNGILVQNNEEPWGGTTGSSRPPTTPACDRGPIQLQDHGHPVRFRNIWLRNLPDAPRRRPTMLTGRRSSPSRLTSSIP